MILKAVIDDHVHELNVPEAFLAQAQGYFEQLDRDMDRGWQMSREWVDRPDRMQRCQIVADKLLTALEAENDRLGVLMAGYLLARLPRLETVELDLQGEMQNHRFTMGRAADAPSSATTPGTGGMSKLDALEQAGREVTQVFKVGRGYRFSVLNQVDGAWRDSPLAATEEEASRLRQGAFKARYEALLSALDQPA